MKTTAKTLKTTILAATFFAVIPLHGIAGEPQRARDLGVPFEGTPGVNNAITDVEGVLVGHTTLISGDGALEVGKWPVRTGVTAMKTACRPFSGNTTGWSNNQRNL